MEIADVVVDRRFKIVDNFVDPLDAAAAATAAALAGQGIHTGHCGIHFLNCKSKGATRNELTVM